MSDRQVNKPTLCIDFDGVVHSYENGWMDGRIYGHVVPGFFAWAQQAQQAFTLVIYSSRSKDPETRSDMINWLMGKYATWLNAQADPAKLTALQVSFAHQKPPAWLTIDDRCVRFMGDWADPALSPEALSTFKPWNVPR